MKVMLYGLAFVTLVFVLLRFTPLYKSISGSYLFDTVNTIDRSITQTINSFYGNKELSLTSSQTGTNMTGNTIRDLQTGSTYLSNTQSTQTHKRLKSGFISKIQTIQGLETSLLQDSGVSRTGDQARTVCTLPWSSETIPDGSQIIAYKNRVADDNNVCEGEIRVCRNGQLGGGFTFQECTYTIDGLNNGREIIAGASSTRHDLFLYTKNEKVDPIYRLGIRHKEDDNKIYDERGMIIKRFDPRGRTRDSRMFLNNNLRYSPDHAVIQSGNQIQDCQFIDNNGVVSRVRHGDYIIAYKKSLISSHETCEFEQRICINGHLKGSFNETACIVIPDTVNIGDGTHFLTKPLPLLSTDHYRNSIVEERIHIFQPPRQFPIVSSGAEKKGSGYYNDKQSCSITPLAFEMGERTKTCTSSECTSYRIRGSIGLKQKVPFLISYTVEIELPSGRIETRKGTILPGMKTIDLTIITDFPNSQREQYLIRVLFRTTVSCFIDGGWQGYRESGYNTVPCRRQLMLNNDMPRITDVCCSIGETINYGKTLPSSNIIDAEEPVICRS